MALLVLNEFVLILLENKCFKLLSRFCSKWRKWIFSLICLILGMLSRICIPLSMLIKSQYYTTTTQNINTMVSLDKATIIHFYLLPFSITYHTINQLFILIICLIQSTTLWIQYYIIENQHIYSKIKVYILISISQFVV